MFWGCVLEKNIGAKLQLEEDTADQEIASLHITSAILAPQSQGKVRVYAQLNGQKKQIPQSNGKNGKEASKNINEKITLAVLEKGKKETIKLDLYFHPTQNVSFSVEGDQSSQVHLTGYFEMLEDEDDDFDEDDEDDEDDLDEDIDPEEFIPADEFIKKRASILRGQGKNPDQVEGNLKYAKLNPDDEDEDESEDEDFDGEQDEEEDDEEEEEEESSELVERIKPKSANSAKLFDDEAGEDDDEEDEEEEEEEDEEEEEEDEEEGEEHILFDDEAGEEDEEDDEDDENEEDDEDEEEEEEVDASFDDERDIIGDDLEDFSEDYDEEDDEGMEESFIDDESILEDDDSGEEEYEDSQEIKEARIVRSDGESESVELGEKIQRDQSFDNNSSAFEEDEEKPMINKQSLLESLAEKQRKQSQEILSEKSSKNNSRKNSENVSENENKQKLKGQNNSLLNILSKKRKATHTITQSNQQSKKVATESKKNGQSSNSQSNGQQQQQKTRPIPSFKDLMNKKNKYIQKRKF